MKTKIAPIVATMLLLAGALFYACGKENVTTVDEVASPVSGLRDNVIDTVADDWSHLSTGDLTFTKCRSKALGTKVMMNEDTVEISTRDGVLYVSHRHMLVNCGFDTVVAEIKLVDDTMVLTEKEVHLTSISRCLCNTDVDYQITGIPNGRYAVKVWDGYGYSVYYKGSVEIK